MFFVVMMNNPAEDIQGFKSLSRHFAESFC
jgi:hypothetical protein